MTYRLAKKMFHILLISLLIFSSQLSAFDKQKEWKKEEATLVKKLEKLEREVEAGNKELSLKKNLDIGSRFDARKNSRLPSSSPYVLDRNNEEGQKDINKPIKYSRKDALNKNEIFSIQNNRPIKNGVHKKSLFSITSSCKISTITNYHHNSKATEAGTIGLRSSRGKKYGPWKANTVDSSGKQDIRYWTVTPKITIPAGTYSIIDSDKKTWSTNTQAKNRGMTQIFGMCHKIQKR